MWVFLGATAVSRTKGTARLLHRLYAKWSAIPHIAQGITIGLAILALFHFAHDAPPIRKAEDAGLDWMIRMYRGVPRPAKTDVHPLVFLDIDERSYRHWGEPLSIPRAKLLSLIRFAVEGGAAAVIVDVELSRPAGDGDDALKSYLSSFANAHPNPPEILLARGLRLANGEDNSLPEQRPSFLDEAVKANPYVHWAAPLYNMDEDAIVRRWRMWEATCTRGAAPDKGKVSVLPSFQLLAAVLLKKNAKSVDLSQSLQQLAPRHCQSRLDEHGPLPEQIKIGDVQFHTEEGTLESRILYSIPWHLKRGENYPTIDRNGERNYPLFSVKPAVVVTENLHSPPPDLSGHIVLIGSSYADSRDTYVTPLGAMPGTMIIANSVLSFYQQGETEEQPWLKYSLEVFLIIAIAVLFAHLPGFVAKLAATVVTLVVILPASFWLFRSGVWLDFALPLAAVELHAIAAEIEEKLGRQHARPHH